MHNNIDTNHAISVITWLSEDMAKRCLLPLGSPVKAVLSAMVIIVKNNLFDFGDLLFFQLLGTAMDTSAAVMWATLYFAYYKVIYFPIIVINVSRGILRKCTDDRFLLSKDERLTPNIYEVMTVYVIQKTL